MSRRAVVLALAAVIAVAVAIPALADSGTTATTASVKGLSVRALGKAKAALRTARAAKRQARAARRTAANAEQVADDAGAAAAGATSVANGARSVANGARVAAGEAQAAAGAARVALVANQAENGFAAAAQSTGSEAFVALPGGPQVSVTVPGSGLIQVWAQAAIEAEGAVSLYQDGEQMPGQAECTGLGSGEGVLFTSPTTEAGDPAVLVGTPGVVSLGFCGSLGAPAPVLFQVAPGRHSYELRYADCGCEAGQPGATFSQRRLVVAPLP